MKIDSGKRPRPDAKHSNPPPDFREPRSKNPAARAPFARTESAAERRAVEFCKRAGVFEKAQRRNSSGDLSRFIDGPITANNRMTVHHAYARTLEAKNADVLVDEQAEISVGLDASITAELKLEGSARQVVRRVLILRKDNGAQFADRMTLSSETENRDFAEVLRGRAGRTEAETLCRMCAASGRQKIIRVAASKLRSKQKVEIGLARRG